MPLLAFLLLPFLVQDPSALKVGRPIPGRFNNSTAQVRTSTLDSDYGDFPTVGRSFRLQVPATGSYSIELRSSAFDAYLILQDANGKVLTEDDDGLIGTDSRITGKFRAEKEYVVVACALHGLRGDFEIELREGKPAKLNAKEKATRAIGYWQGRANYLEQQQQRMTDEFSLAMDGIGEALMNLGRPEEAEEYLRASWVIRLQVLGLQDAWAGVSANNLALCLKNQGKFEEAIELYQKALESWTLEFGPDDYILSRVEQNLGALYINNGELELARKHLQHSLQLLESQYGKRSPELITCLSNLGMLNKQTGEYALAQEALQRSLNLTSKTLGPEDPKVATVMGNLGLILQERGNFAEAQMLHQKALQICTDAYGENSPRLAPHLNNLGLLYERQGEYARALQLFERSAKVAKATGNADGFEVAKTLINLGYQLNGLGRYAEAGKVIQEAMQIMEKLGNPVPDLQAKGLVLLASMQERQGDLVGALELAGEGVAIIEQAFGEHSYKLAMALATQVRLRQLNGDYDIALELAKRCLEIDEKVFGAVHQLTSNDWISLAGIYFNQGEFEQAKQAAEQARGIRRQVYGAQHPAVANAVVVLGRIQHSQGDLQAARASYTAALTTLEQFFGKDHQNYSRNAIRLGKVLAELGELEQARQTVQTGLSGYMRVLDRELPSMNEAGRLRMLEQSANPEPLLALLSQMEQPDLQDAYNFFVQRKGKATRLQAASLKLAQANQDEGARRLHGEIQQVTTELASLVMVPVQEQKADHARTISKLRAQRLKTETKFNQLLGLQQQLQTPDWQEVQAEMPANSALIDFFVGESVYAWVLKPDSELQLLTLGKADVLRARLNAYLQQTKNRGGAPLLPKAKDPAVELYQALWQPLASAIGEVQAVYICPDGFLCELPFGVLTANQQDYLLERYRFHYLADPTRFSALEPQPQSAEGSLLMVGGVNYFRREELAAEEGSSIAVPQATSSSSRARVSSNWSSLPATRDELQSLQDLHKYVLEWQAPLTVVEGKAATEERVRAEIAGAKYVHLATHGYFEPDHLPSLLADAAGMPDAPGIDQQLRAVGMLPGLLSGLVLAGVNGEADPNRDDGYLSAEEIQHLDLTDCELVVLSACETALGSARSGEGLMSLRRAFSVAGANTVVSSLWRVDDQATALLMKDFYTNLWQKEMPRGLALHQAKLQMLRRNRAETGGKAMPSTWGAFVLSGDWR
ncbi:MAG: tetratricopeptide repeat protein [Planctomycetes bacterium]|nr:tetratricopeptide repeat protein [Planctomycetota bacterium]